MSIFFEGLLPGVHVSPSSSFTLAAGQSQQVTLTADISAPAGGATITIRGTSGTISHTYLFVVQVYSPPAFKISVTPPTLSLTPASIGTLHISTTAAPGTSLRMYTDFGLFNGCGVDFDYRDFGATSDHPGTLPVRASAVAQPFQNVPIVITATNDATNQTSMAAVTLNVTVPFPQVTTPTRSTFVRTDEKPAAAVYDAKRKLVFVTLQITNQVRVLSSTDGHLVATIPVEQPFGIDETPDGGAVLVGGYSPNIAVINPDLLQVTRLVPAPHLSTPGVTVDFIFPKQVVALSTGNALILGQHGYTTMTYVYFWNRTTDQMTVTEVPGLFFPSQIHRTDDGSTAVVSWSSGSGQAITFLDASGNSFSAPVPVALFSALRPDGHQFAGFLDQGDGVGFFDPQGNLVGSIPWLGGLSFLIYSVDGKRLYAFGPFGPTMVDEVAILDTQNFSLLGMVPDLGYGNTPLAIDETGMIFGASPRGVAFLDVQSSGAFTLPLPGQFTLAPQLVSQSAPVAVKLNTSGLTDQAKNYSIFIGAPPASPDTLVGTNISDPASHVIQMMVPPGPRPGPANVTLVHSDGWFEVQPEAVTYGPSIVNISPNAATPAGGTQFTLLGYGLDAVGVQVTIGGQPAKILQVTPAVFQGYYAPFMFSSLKVLSPPGPPGLADVAVITPNGSTTVRGGYQYLDFVQVFPREGGLDDMVYDRQRQRLYLSNEDHNRVEIFDLRSQTYLPPIAVGNSPTGIALTPDGQLLAVMNSDDGTISIINPDQMSVISTKPALTPSDQEASCLGRDLMISPAGDHRMLIDVVCTYLLASGRLHLLDLDSGSLSCSGVVSCDASQQNISFSSGFATMASSPDGSKIFLSTLKPMEGPVGLLDFKANTLTTASNWGSSDAALNADGNWFVADFNAFDSSLFPVSMYTSVSYAYAGPYSYNNIYGERLSPSGSLLFMPNISGVDIFDSHQGRLVLQVGLPDPLPYCFHALVLDETGSKMFLISNSGITLAQLYKVPLSIAPVSLGAAAAGSTVTIRGSGFVNGARVEFGGVRASTTFVDQNTLQAIVPARGGDSTAVAVVNPDGERYSLEAGFFWAPPKSSIDLQINSGGAGLTTTIDASGPTNSGYAALTLNSGSPPYGTAVFRLKQNGVVVSEVGVPPSPPITSARFFVDYRPAVSTKSGQVDAGAIVVNTGFAAVNQGMGSARLTLRFRDAGGNQLAQGAITLPPHAHLAKFIDQLPPDFVLPSGFGSTVGFGTMEIASDLPVSILALRLTTNQRGETLITSTPIANQAQTGANGPLSFPQFVEGGGYLTTLILMNASSTTETGMIRIYDDNGAPLAMHFVGTGSATASLPYNIAPGGFLRVQTDGSSPGIEAGSAQVIPDSGTEIPVGAGIFGYTTGGILVTESGIPAGTMTTHARVFIEISGGHDTGLAVANTLSGAELSITLNAYAMDGITPLGTTSFILGPNAHAAKFVGEFVAGLGPGFTGVLDLRSGTPFSALTLRSLTNERDDFLLTTFPVADMNQPAPSPLVFPQIADGGGYQTEFILINPSGSASAVTLNLFGGDGTPLPVGKSGH